MGLNTKKQDTGPAVEGLQVPKALSTTGTPSGDAALPQGVGDTIPGSHKAISRPRGS